MASNYCILLYACTGTGLGDNPSADEDSFTLFTNNLPTDSHLPKSPRNVSTLQHQETQKVRNEVSGSSSAENRLQCQPEADHLTIPQRRPSLMRPPCLPELQAVLAAMAPRKVPASRKLP
jgi:hypothetical protein